jgi:hypothetical protein
MCQQIEKIYVKSQRSLSKVGVKINKSMKLVHCNNYIIPVHYIKVYQTQSKYLEVHIQVPNKITLQMI